MEQSIISIIVGSVCLVVGIVIGKLIFSQPYLSQYEVKYQYGSGTLSTFVSGRSKGDALRNFETNNPLKIVLSVKLVN